MRRAYRLRGVVQGVGFRPHVAKVATDFPLTGFVGNDDESVFIEAQGTASDIENFMAKMLATLPPLASVLQSVAREIPEQEDESGFRIVSSRRRPGARTLIPPDTATCPDCCQEMVDPNNRRYHYPFITCTNCGPRATIMMDLPYDRDTTTMVKFPMCPACRAEYTDPENRRYHAQPVSCFDCGPVLWVSGSQNPVLRPPAGDRRPLIAAALAEARARLRRGEILAVKGIGGFHLLCDARNQEAVARLRKRKNRGDKPFAVMAPNIKNARRLAELNGSQLEELSSPARPIVIAPFGSGYDLAPAVAPGLGDVGILLPYAPLHLELLSAGCADMALVATSGNLAGEPLCFTNEDALARLAGIADGFVFHDRDIHLPMEDSVFLANSQVTIPSRRSRGYAPLPVALPQAAAAPILAVGGELKNSFCLASGDWAHISGHIGDMGTLASQEALDRAVTQMLNFQHSRPEKIVCDLHPAYSTVSWASRFAEQRDIELLQVQHHVAHAYSLLAERSHLEPAVVVAVDGTGYGTDGTIWGGEILEIAGAAWYRRTHLPSFSLVGGDRAVRYPWRVALGIAHDWNLEWITPKISAEIGDRQGKSAELKLVKSQLNSGFGVVATTSCGRLFDAAAAILGICTEVTYEAQAAMELEHAATSWANRHIGAPALRFNSYRELFEMLAEEEREVGERAWQFHLGLAQLLTTQAEENAQKAGIKTVGLTGGVALNRLFSSHFIRIMREGGYEVLTHKTVPPNDGGLSLGQAWAAVLGAC
ncbi:carbamoyltransferase HypF [Varibaculum cambriense]|uniref:carbamoyltransferase HypF n=1 Tax=Varibaculum cambriense TaxID=184870 RepID=UPI000C7B6DD5|nr:carbamoyltransferase HypF [Varibaculum cambriense]WIK87820.1 carbamoyltransferase HypF [Varibaculum cambriense]